MSSPCDHVSRGDLITAKFMNDCVLDRLKDLEVRLAAVEVLLKEPGGTVKETVKVPNVVGKTLSEALKMLVRVGLSKGRIYAGTSPVTDTKAIEMAQQKVLSQQPPAETEVAPKAAVNLYFPESTQQRKPSIYALNPTSASAKEIVTVSGRDFDLPFEDNGITVAGKQAEITSGDESSMDFAVPDLGVAQDLKCDVVVTFAASNLSLTCPIKLTVKGKGPKLPPKIKEIIDKEEFRIPKPGEPVENKKLNPGDYVMLAGSDFSVNPEDNIVSIIINDRIVNMKVVAVADDGTMIRAQIPEDADLSGISAEAETSFSVLKKDGATNASTAKYSVNNAVFTKTMVHG